MGKNVILPEQTVRDLLEAYASLAAWYYQLWGALRTANGGTEPPSEAASAAFVARLAQDYPEIAAVARTITNPRQFVPPPAATIARPSVPAPYAEMDRAADEPATLIEPAPARRREIEGSEPPPGVAPPPMVAPGTVKYDR